MNDAARVEMSFVVDGISVQFGRPEPRTIELERINPNKLYQGIQVMEVIQTILDHVGQGTVVVLKPQKA